MKSLLFVFFIASFVINSNAQTKVENSKPIATSPQLEDIVVKDSAGVVYEAAKWQILLTTGKYRLRLMNDHKTTLIYKLSELELSKKYESLPKPKESLYFKTGTKISPFRESDIKGNKFNLKELTGKIVVLNFWFIGCPPCRQEIPELNELVDKYRNNKDVVFIAIALDEKRDIVDFLKTIPFKYNIIDHGRYIADQYKILYYPTNVVIDRQGTIVFHTTDFYTNTVYWIGKIIETELKKEVVVQ